MRKISAEMPSNPQQNHPGMESNASIESDVATIAAAGDLPSRMGMRAVSFWIKFPDAGGASALLGSRLVAGSNGFGGAPVGFGRGCKTGASTVCGSNPGGRRNIVSGLWGSGIRTVSFFGSAMTNQIAPRKITENSLIVTP